LLGGTEAFSALVPFDEDVPFAALVPFDAVVPFDAGQVSRASWASG